MIQNKSLRYFLSAISLQLLVSCGGGGGTVVDDERTPPSGKLNPDLSGKLLFNDSDSAWLMDLQTGNYTQIPNTYWNTHTSTFGDANLFWLNPAPFDKTEFIVESLDDCADTAFDNEICIAIQDYDGNYLANYRYLGDSRSPAKLSWDQQYFALFNLNRSTGQDRLQIYDRGGNLLDSADVEDAGFAWMPDNRIIYADDRKFLITKSLSSEAEFQIELPAQVLGSVGRIAVSPGGDRYVFTLISSGTLVSTNATPWIMNRDGTNLRQLATSSQTEPSITFPQWSPDGEWILLKEGGYTGSDPLNPGSSGYAYAVPSENLGKVFILSPVNSERSPEVRLLNRYDFLNGTPTTTITNTHFASEAYWIP